MTNTYLLLEKFISTPLGEMRALASESALHFLHFVDTKSHQRLSKKTSTPGENAILSLIASELEDYFQGSLQYFQTPIILEGTTFQIKAWQELLKVSYGKTVSYKTQALKIGHTNAYRAVAQANSANPLTLIVPCHRVIHARGTLGGYAGEVYRKKWLLEHENAMLIRRRQYFEVMDENYFCQEIERTTQ